MKVTQRPYTLSNPCTLRWGIFVFTLLMLGSLNACVPGNVTPFPVEEIAPTPTPVPPIPVQTATPPTPANITLTEAQHQQTTSAQVGNVINVRGFTEGNWTLSYNATFLELMTAPEIVSQPGPDGWLFRALAPGETVILLESVPPPCPTEPCMPNIQRFEFPIQVVP